MHEIPCHVCLVKLYFAMYDWHVTERPDLDDLLDQGRTKTSYINLQQFYWKTNKQKQPKNNASGQF